ncbi:hypothetical protein [Neolewinella antarctica]|uniref:Uncharacterized protein n=1 Tax=Neolewinella antarctica TaxID=442734 RepID=A0ABX0X9N6_9BACT|nr:hypothetical protein [Neolewinella antarctica]NJC25980.1 hypothetical protein [Neolewinella antarctica]
MVRLLLILLSAVPVIASAQFPLSVEFEQILDSFDVRVNHPDEQSWKVLNPHDNDYLSEQQRLYSKPDKLEVRFTILAEDSAAAFFQYPHIQAGHLAMNLASNEEDALTTVLSLDEEEMTALNADWARVYLFRPKRGFADRRQAQLVASYKEGRGMLYTVLLFDRPPADLLDRQLTLMWR